MSKKNFKFLKNVRGYKDKFKNICFGTLQSHNLVSLRAVRSILEDSLCVRILIHVFTHNVFPGNAQVYK